MTWTARSRNSVCLTPILLVGMLTSNSSTPNRLMVQNDSSADTRNGCSQGWVAGVLSNVTLPIHRPSLFFFMRIFLPPDMSKHRPTACSPSYLSLQAVFCAIKRASFLCFAGDQSISDRRRRIVLGNNLATGALTTFEKRSLILMDDEERTGDLLGNRLLIDASFAYGILNWLDLGAVLPIAMGQTGLTSQRRRCRDLCPRRPANWCKISLAATIDPHPRRP